LIKCPLVNKEIDIGECVTIVDVCDGFVKETVISKSILKKENWKDICKNCEYHEN
jgi:hypothetical protein